MVRALLLTLVVLLLGPDALAAPSVWAETSVRVLDYTTPRWDWLVEGMVDEFNGMLPELAPQLVYRRMPQRVCQDLKPHPFVRAIVVCSVPTAPFVGMTGVLHDGKPWSGGFGATSSSSSSRWSLSTSRLQRHPASPVCLEPDRDLFAAHDHREPYRVHAHPYRIRGLYGVFGVAGQVP